MANRTFEQSFDSVAGQRAMQRGWRWLLVLGIMWIALGALAIVMPFAATLSLELLLGAIFMVGGVAQVFQAIQWRGWRGFALHVLGGVVALIFGGLLLVYPTQGVMTLTLFLSAFFLVEGIFKVLSAIQHRSFAGWRWLLLSGVVSIAIAALIWLGWPGTARWVLGLLTGVALLFSGWSAVMLAVSARCD